MKKALVLVIISLSLICSTLSAQTIKLGHINSAELMKAMPEMDSAEVAIRKYGVELEGNIQTMKTELQNKYLEYQNNEKQMSDLIKATKQREINDLNGRMEEFAAQADEDYKVKQQTLLAPIIDRAKVAIQAVAKELNYSYIFDSSGGVLIYSAESDDVMPLVKKKLGLK